MKANKTIRRNMCGVAAALLVTSSIPAYAAVTPEAPTAGSTLSDLNKTELRVPDQRETPKTEVAQTVKPPLAADQGLQVYISDFRITGQLPVPESEIYNLIAGSKGKDLSLAAMEELTGRITKYLQKNGYLVARAYLPAQDIKDGLLEIAVVIGQYDQITFRNQSGVANSAVKLEMGSVQSGAYIEKKELERALWLIGDLAGAEAKATLAPGSKAGTSNLIVDILPKGKRVSGSISVDNYGNRYSGREQLSLNTMVLNPAHRGDTLSVNGITTGDGLTSGGISYKMSAFAPGGKLEFGYSKMQYSLSNPFDGFTGTADVGSVTYTQNFQRSRQSNLYGGLGLNMKNLYDDNNSGNYKHSKSQAWTAGVSGDALDNWGGGGTSVYGLSYTAGRLDLQNAADLASDQGTAETNGSFGKWSAFFGRQQYINERLSLMLVMTGQRANKNLDASEKMTLGGPYGVRAYPRGEAAGDEGYQATAELRWTTPVKNKASVFQVVGFLDTGSVTANKNPWSIADNHRSLHGGGLGFVWNEPGDSSFRVHYAWKLGSEEAVSDTDRNGRLWLQCTKLF